MPPPPLFLALYFTRTLKKIEDLTFLLLIKTFCTLFDSREIYFGIFVCKMEKLRFLDSSVVTDK